MKEKAFEPLIKGQKSTLKDKEVNIKDTMNFERRSVITTTGTGQDEKKKVEEKSKEKELKRRKITMKTQKMSLDVLLKLDILDPFLRSTEAIDNDSKISINEKIEILIESYVTSKLSARQLEGYNAIYNSYLDT